MALLLAGAGISGALAESAASFPGGEEALQAYLTGNIKYPVLAKENGIEGTVTVNFVVTDEGKVSEVKVARPLDPDLEAEAVRLINGMPVWIPATDASGKPVPSTVTIPVKFRLKD